MNFQKFLWILFLLLFPSTLFARVVFVSLFPNTIDDAKLEYIEFRNTGCESMSLSGYTLEDASGKKYIFSSGAIIESQKNLQIGRVISKIILNNEDETVFIRDASGKLTDQFSYAKSTKGVVISIQPIDEVCEKIQTRSQSGNTGTQSTISGNLLSQTGRTNGVSGEVSMTQTGNVVSSEVSFSHSNPSVSGEINITQAENILAISETGIVQNSGSMIQIPFPDIFPTLQSPTNAVFSGGYFDCRDLDICRINPTFDPIFTGSFLIKNYICEVITQTGMLTTCNPNTLYFPREGNFSLKLISKLDPSQSKIISWEVRFSQKKSEISVTVSSDTLSGNIFSGSTLTGNIENLPILSPIFPEIIPTFQNYTNTTFSGNILTCITSPCRVNFTLEPMFVTPFFQKDFSCQILYGSGVYESCNPPQMYLTGTGNVEVVITEKHSLEKRRKIFSVAQVIPHELPHPDGEKPSSKQAIEIEDIVPPIAFLDHDGKWKEYFYQVTENELDCYSETCSLNFTAERSYDPGGGKIRFLWIFDTNIISTSRDPGSHAYGMGDHTIILRVIDMAENFTEVRYKLHVLGKRKKEEKKIANTSKYSSGKESKKIGKILESFDKKIEKLEQKLDTKITKERKKKQKKLKFLFFSPPEIVLQGKTGKKISDSQYLCITIKNNCKLNFTLTGTNTAYRYEWIFSENTQFTGKNPKAVSFPIGKHVIHLVVYPKTGKNPLWKKDIIIQVVKKAKKVKKKKVKKPSQKNPKKEEIKKEVSEVSFQMEHSGILGVFLFLAGIGGVAVFQRRKTQK